LQVPAGIGISAANINKEGLKVSKTKSLVKAAEPLAMSHVHDNLFVMSLGSRHYRRKENYCAGGTPPNDCHLAEDSELTLTYDDIKWFSYLA